MDKNVVAISLFSGAGGLGIASFLAGVPVILSTDIDPDCIQTLQLNELFRNAKIIEGDVHQIESSVFSDALRQKDYDRFIVIGGAPCQPFSKAGYWVGNNTRKGINDPRATLVDEYLRVVRDLHPGGFVFENVESLLHPTPWITASRKNGNGCSSSALWVSSKRKSRSKPTARRKNAPGRAYCHM